MYFDVVMMMVLHITSTLASRCNDDGIAYQLSAKQAGVSRRVYEKGVHERQTGLDPGMQQIQHRRVAPKCMQH